MEAAGRAGDRRGQGRPPARSCPTASRASTSTGWRTSTTGASRASSGGATASRSGTARPAARSTVTDEETLDRLPALRRAGRAGSGRARHLVLLRTVAVLDARLAGRHPGPAPLLPLLGDGDRLRHPLLLGGADDLLRARGHGRGAVPHRLPARHRARRRRRQDEQDQGQRARPDRDHRRVRRRRAALRARHPERARATTCKLEHPEGRGRPQLRQQALERDPLRACARSATPRSSMGERRPGAPQPATLALADRWILSRLDADDRRRHPPDARCTSTARPGGRSASSSGRSSATGTSRRPRSGCAERRAERQAVAQTLAYALERAVRLLHPFMPFVTEALWQELPHVGESVMIASWPEAGARDEAAETRLRRPDRDRARHSQRPHRSERRARPLDRGRGLRRAARGGLRDRAARARVRWPASPTTSWSSATRRPRRAAKAR